MFYHNPQKFQVGVLMSNCPCLVSDVQKIFDMYWYLSQPNTALPSQWPSEWNTKYNKNNPANVTLSGTKAHAYISVSRSRVIITIYDDVTVHEYYTKSPLFIMIYNDL